MVSGPTSCEPTTDNNKLVIKNSCWNLVDEIREMPLLLADDDDLKNEIVHLLEELVSAVVAKAHNGEVVCRNMQLSEQEKDTRNFHRTTSIVVQDWDHLNHNNNHHQKINQCKNEFLLQRSASERIFGSTARRLKEDFSFGTTLLAPIQISTINDNNNSSKPSSKRKKRLSFNSIFHIKPKKDLNKNNEEEASETYDNFSHQMPDFKSSPLSKTRKYSSTFELSTHSKQEKPSFLKKLASSIGEAPTNFLKRSLSFRDVRKREPSSSLLLKEQKDKKKEEWRQSLQSLVENDISVSYKDLSFINYDVLNEFNYAGDNKIIGDRLKPDSGIENSCNFVGRTQSMREKGSSHLTKSSFYHRQTSVTPDYRSSLSSIQNFNDTSARSLPSLYHEHHNYCSTEAFPSIGRHRRQREPSVRSEDDGRMDNDSFRSNSSSGGSSTGGVFVKLRRHNATRQKIRHPATFIEDRSKEKIVDQKVRSRSLNHLDSLDMRQTVVPTTDSALKDSKSEPDCTKPIPIPPTSSPGLTVSEETGAVSSSASASVVAASSQQPLPSAARKYMLSRSQKSSSECFSVNFEVGDESTWDNELFFPAQRGITLHESLAKLCEFHNIDLSICEARLQDKECNSESIITFAQDTANLVGRHVRITAKDSSNKKYHGSSSFHSNHSRKQSGSYRPRTSSFFNSSTEDQNVVSSNLSLHDSDQSRKQIKQRITAFFGNSKDTKYEALIEQLDRYSKYGIPQNVDYPQGQCESIDALYKLEDDWRDILTEYADLNDRQQQQQTALWELIKTEVAYIKTLKVVTDLFLGCLRDLQSKNLFKEIDTEKLFSNITEILGANVIFWRNTLFPLVRDMRKYKRSTCLENMLEGFSKLPETFQPYYKYCAEQSRCQHYCRENLESEVFTAYLTWCESQKDCNRLRLMDILVQPMQRLTKYGLLLKAILKNTEEDVEKESLQTMIKLVDDFVNNVNSSLKHRQDKERLKGIIARIESYDIVESKDDDIERILKREKSFTQLDLTRPMLGCQPERKRHLLLEGDLKLKDSGASKIEVHCFLLTDMLLVCKPSTKKGVATMRVIRQPYLVDRLVVQDLNRETPSLAVIYRNEFDMAIAAFILQNNDAKKIKGWKDGIAKAQSLYAQAKQMSYVEGSLDTELGFDYNLESDYHSLQLAPKSPMASSSRASRVSSLVHSHSGSMEMNDQSSVGSAKEQSRGISLENENRTGSISSDEGLQPLPPDANKVIINPAGVQNKGGFKNRLFHHKTPNTLSVQPVGSLGQSLPNLSLGSPNFGSGLTLNFNQNTLLVPGNKNGSQLLSPTHRGISYPPPSPTRGNLRRSLAISQNKNPPLIKTRQVNSTSSVTSSQVPVSLDFDVPVIAGVSSRSEENCESFSRGQHRQAMKRNHRYNTASLVDDIKKNDLRDPSIHKRLSWNYGTIPKELKEPLLAPAEDQT